MWAGSSSLVADVSQWTAHNERKTKHTKPPVDIHSKGVSFFKEESKKATSPPTTKQWGRQWIRALYQKPRWS